VASAGVPAGGGSVNAGTREVVAVARPSVQLRYRAPMSDPLRAHRSAGRELEVDGVTTFVRDEGEGDPVLLMHGVPVSSYVYRKLLPELAARGRRAIAFDYPGCGLAARPAGFDYSWTGLGAYAAKVVDALGLERFDLLVHDIGGPVGFELIARRPARIASLTLLNTLVHASRFTKPWPMRPFEKPVLGEVWLGSMIAPVFVQLMYRIGISDRSISPPEEVRVHLELLERDDGGKAFLKIMRGFEANADKERLYLRLLREATFPMQAIWGRDDPALRVDVQGARVRELVGGDRFFEVAGLHFVQESAAVEIAERVVSLRQ